MLMLKYFNLTKIFIFYKKNAQKPKKKTFEHNFLSKSKKNPNTSPHPARVHTKAYLTRLRKYIAKSRNFGEK
jgi:hypothetical protein